MGAKEHRMITTLFRRLVTAMGLSAVVVASTSPRLFADDDAFRPPSYRSLRYREDWRGLEGRDTSTTGDTLDPIKYVPITDNGDLWVSFGGQARSRVESWENFGFGAPGADRDDTFWINRLRYHMDVHYSDTFRFFVEGKNAWSSDRDLPGRRSPAQVDEWDLQNAFVDVNVPVGGVGKLTLRPGRQEMELGKQRLVSSLDWLNVRRTFEGINGIFTTDNWKVTSFYLQFVPIDKYKLNDADRDVQFYGVYAEGNWPTLQDRGVKLDSDLYFLGLDRSARVVPGGGYNGTSGGEERWTLGGRVGGHLLDTGLDFDLEGAIQAGRVGSQDIDAFFMSTSVGYQLEAHASPRLYLGLDFASGDNKAGGDVQTFSQLFPLGHAYLGFIDVIGRQNNVAFSTGIALKPTEKVVCRVDGFYFLRASNDDAVYNPGSGVVRATGTSGSRDVGAEIDFTVKYIFNRHFVGAVGYSHFFPGEFIEETGLARDIDFYYLMSTFTF